MVFKFSRSFPLRLIPRFHLRLAYCSPAFLLPARTSICGDSIAVLNGISHCGIPFAGITPPNASCGFRKSPWTAFLCGSPAACGFPKQRSVKTSAPGSNGIFLGGYPMRQRLFRQPTHLLRVFSQCNSFPACFSDSNSGVIPPQSRRQLLCKAKTPPNGKITRSKPQTAPRRKCRGSAGSCHRGVFGLA